MINRMSSRAEIPGGRTSLARTRRTCIASRTGDRILIRSRILRVLREPNASANVQETPPGCPSPSCPIRARSLTSQHPDTPQYGPDHSAPNSRRREPPAASEPTISCSTDTGSRPTRRASSHRAKINGEDPNTEARPNPVIFLQCADAPAVLDALRGITLSHDNQTLLERLSAWDHTVLGALAGLFRRVRIADSQRRRK